MSENNNKKFLHFVNFLCRLMFVRSIIQDKKVDELRKRQETRLSIKQCVEKQRSKEAKNKKQEANPVRNDTLIDVDSMSIEAVTFKRKIALKYRNKATKLIKLAKLKARAARFIVFDSDNSDDSDKSDKICSFENLTDFDPESHDSFERETDFQENDILNSDVNSLNGNFDCCDNVISSNENNSVIRDSMDVNKINDGVEQDNKQSDIASNFNDKEQQNNYLLHMLREWAMRGVSKKKVDALLALLASIFPFLPKNHKTLLHCSRKVIVCNVDNGLLWYKGIKPNIQQVLSDEYIHEHDYFSKLMKVDEQTDEYTAVGRILPKVITNSLARIINYAGSDSVKLKFEDTKLHEAINCAVFKSFLNSNLTQAEKKMSRWFQTSNQRKI